MTKLSVNINKVATLRNARGGNVPDLLKFASDCESYGAQGITVHPRPDERHVKYQDVRELKKIVKTELNVEGYPDEKFINLVLEVNPHQVTLVPDPPNALTSNAGWDIEKNFEMLFAIIEKFKHQHIRTSVFVGTSLSNLEFAKKLGTDRIEFYTEPYAQNFEKNRFEAVREFSAAANKANQLGLGINAGHDLNSKNLNFFYKNMPGLLEVSIGHALISDALYWGIENSIQIYLRQLK
jgi:pyridoxine 5-phosphate synthase